MANTNLPRLGESSRQVTPADVNGSWIPRLKYLLLKARIIAEQPPGHEADFDSDERKTVKTVDCMYLILYGYAGTIAAISYT